MSLCSFVLDSTKFKAGHSGYAKGECPGHMHCFLLVFIRSLSALKYVYLPENCELRNLTCTFNIFIRCWAVAGRDG